jgi:hypothetical protein
MVLLYSLESFHLRVVDIVDVVLFAIILYQVYNLIKGTAAIRISCGRW